MQATAYIVEYLPRQAFPRLRQLASVLVVPADDAHEGDDDLLEGAMYGAIANVHGVDFGFERLEYVILSITETRLTADTVRVLKFA